MPSLSTSQPTTPPPASRRPFLLTLLLPVLVAAAVALYAKSSLSPSPTGIVWGPSGAPAPPFPATSPGTQSLRVQILDPAADRLTMSVAPIIVGPHAGAHTATVIFSQCVLFPRCVYDQLMESNQWTGRYGRGMVELCAVPRAAIPPRQVCAPHRVRIIPLTPSCQ